jgi:pyruvate dehydrogenase (quinone)
MMGAIPPPVNVFAHFRANSYAERATPTAAIPAIGPDHHTNVVRVARRDGLVNYGTDLDNPDFAAVARAVGLFGVRVEHPGQLDDALRAAFAHPGPAVVDVVTARQELALPPKISFAQARGFTLWATRSVLSGDGSAVLEVARTNLRQLAIE